MTITTTIGPRTAAINALSLALLIMGAIIFHLSLYSLATNTALPYPNFDIVLVFGVLLIALSVTLFTVNLLSYPASTRPDNFYVLYVLVLSLTFALTRLSRFGGVSGFDAVREGEVSLGTYNSNYWQVNYGTLTNYQSSLAITILPSIMGRILGVPSDAVLLIQTFLMMAFLPVAVQAVTSVLTGSPRLGALSGVLIATNWFFFGAHLIGKTEMALFLATLSVYCLARREGKLRTLGILLGAGVVMSHYTIGLYYSGVLLIILSWSKIVGSIVKYFPGFHRMAIPPFHTWRPLIAIALVILWLSYAAPLALPTLASSGVQAITGLFIGGPKRADTGLALSNTAVTFWFDFQNGLLVLGALLAVNYYRKGRIVGNLAIWTVAGVLLILMPIAWILVPSLSVQVESTRIIGMILPFSILLVARLFMRVYAFPGRLWKAAVIIVVLLLVPMNLMLLNPQEVLYNQPNTLSSSKMLDLETSYLPLASNYGMAYWMNAYVTTSSPVESDAVSHYALQTSLPFPSHIISFQEDTPQQASSTTRYVTFTSYFANLDVWTKSSLGAVNQYDCHLERPCSSVLFFQPCEQSPTCQAPIRNVVYSSGRFWVVSSPLSATT